MKTTGEDIFAIIDGSPIEISEPCPLPEMVGRRWLIRQPDDWIYDMAQKVFDAKRAIALLQPEIAECKALPPSELWTARQVAAAANSQRRLQELNDERKQRPLTVEEELEAKNYATHLRLLIQPEEYSLADEMAHDIASKHRDWYLLQKLIIDDAGNRLFDQTTEQGKQNWEFLGRDYRERVLRVYATKVLVLVQTAKNSEASQSSN